MESLTTKEKKNDKFAIFHIEGGHGKNILATAVLRALKKQYPEYKFIIITPWDAPWLYNPDVYRVYNFGQIPYFYDDYIKDNPHTKIFRSEPYHQENHILQKKHLTETWTDMFNVNYDGYQPKIYLNPREVEIARDKIKPDGRPIMLLQTHGGGGQQYSKKSWARDLPIQIAQSLVDHYVKKYRILHIRREDQPALKNTELLQLPHRELYAVFPLSEKRLFIDSFSQHTAAALGLNSTVCWISNKPEIFGYAENNNILPKAKLINQFNKLSYLEQYDITGQVQQFPYDDINVFDINEIVKAIDN